MTCVHVKQKNDGKHMYRFIESQFYGIPSLLETLYTIEPTSSFITTITNSRAPVERAMKIAGIARYELSKELNSKDVLATIRRLADKICDKQSSSFEKCLQLALSGSTNFDSVVGRFIPCKEQNYDSLVFPKCTCDITWINERLVTAEIN